MREKVRKGRCRQVDVSGRRLAVLNVDPKRARPGICGHELQVTANLAVDQLSYPLLKFGEPVWTGDARLFDDHNAASGGEQRLIAGLGRAILDQAETQGNRERQSQRDTLGER